MYTSIKRDIFHEAEEVKEELSGGQKQKTPSAEPDYFWKRDVVLAVFPPDTEMRNVWNKCLNKVELGLGWRRVELR